MTKSSQPTLILPPSAKFRRQQKSNGSYEMVEAYTKEEVLAILVSFMSWTKMEDGKPTVDGHLCAVLAPDSMYSEVWPARWNATCGTFDAAAGWFEADEVVAWMTLPTSDLLDKLESRDPPVPPVDTGTQGTPINTDLPPGQDITLPPPDMTIATEDPAGEVPAPEESTGSIAFDYLRQVMEAEEKSLVRTHPPKVSTEDVSTWSPIQICTWIGNKVASEMGPMVSRDIPRFIRSLGRHAHLVKRFLVVPPGRASTQEAPPKSV